MSTNYIQNFIDKIRKKYKKRILKYSKNNNIKISNINSEQIILEIMGENNTIEIDNTQFCDKNSKAQINIMINGSNNYISIGKISLFKDAKVYFLISGDKNNVILKDKVSISQTFNVQIGSDKEGETVTNSSIFIDENTGMESMNYMCRTSNTPLKIGKDCMISFDVNIYNTDSHPILDLETKKLINHVHRIEIGDHVWLGAKSTILKNVVIPDDCIIGWGGVVSSSINKDVQPHSIIAGNPAKIVKTGVTWDSDCTKYNFAQNTKE